MGLFYAAFVSALGSGFAAGFVGDRPWIFASESPIVDMAPLDTLLHDERVNGVLGWGFTGGIVAVAVVNALRGDLVWAILSLLVAIVVAVPALSTRRWTVMVPWPLPSVAALAVASHTVGWYPEFAGFLALAAFALVAVVDLDVFTSVELSRRFAVAFAVMTTMAAQGLWTVAQFYSDRWLGTDYLTSQVELQWDLVAVTVVALVFGALFELYVARFEHVGSHRHPPADLGIA